jgi:hypothetical protein
MSESAILHRRRLEPCLCPVAQRNVTLFIACDILAAKGMATCMYRQVMTVSGALVREIRARHHTRSGRSR